MKVKAILSRTTTDKEKMFSDIFWRNEKRKVKDLKPFPGNPRRANEKEYEDLNKSLERFNLADSLIINTDNTVIGGNFRLKILNDRGVEEVDVRVPSRTLTEEEVKELNLRLNKNQGEWDWDLLANFDENLLKEVGFENEELDEIFGLEVDEEFDVEKELNKVLENKERRCNIGDLWQLNEHRLYIGDATKKEGWEKVLQGEKIDMVFTDPPYNVNYGISKKTGNKIKKIIGDNQTAEEWEKFNKLWIQNAIDFYNKNGGDIYYWGASGPEGMKQRLWLVEKGFHWSATIVWVKDKIVLSPAKYQRQYEPCFYGWYKKSSYRGGRKQSEVWEFPKPCKSLQHPTMKPIALCQKAIKNSSKRGDIVMDCFGGSGSTLIACEIMKRKCRMIEIDPTYGEVIINRWEKFTGKEAVKIN